MGIPEDYYRATGETMGQACRRLAATTPINTIAQIIGYTSASGLRYALEARGIEIDWPEHYKRPEPRQRPSRRRDPSIPHGNSRPRTYTPEMIGRFQALRDEGLSISAAAAELGVHEANMLRAIRQRVA